MLPQVLLIEPLLSITSLLIVILLPVLFLLLIPVYLIRLLVQSLAKFYKPEFSEMLYGYSSLLATLQSDPHCWGCFGLVIQNDGFKLEKVLQVGRVLLTNRKYQRAKQSLVSWMGFSFWKNDTNFNLENHLITHEEPITSSQFDGIRDGKFIDEKFNKDKPLWEMHIFKNYILENLDPGNSGEGGHILIAFRSHHCLHDWFSMVEVVEDISQILNIPSNCFNNLNPNNNNPLAIMNGNSKNFKSQEENMKTYSQHKVQEEKYELLENKSGADSKAVTKPEGESVKKPELSMSSWVFYFYCIKLVLCGPFLFFRTLITSVVSSIGNYVDKKPLKEYNYFETVIPLDYVRRISAKNGVKTPAVTLAALTAALRQLLIDLDVNPIPQTVSVAGPVPLSWKRPNGLNNNSFSTIPVQVPVGESDPFIRLHVLNTIFDNLKYSTTILTFNAFFYLIGGLVNWMIKPLATSATRAASFTMAPGPANLSQLLGLNIKRFIANGGMPYGDVVILGFYSLSVNGQLTIRVKGDKIVFPTQLSSERFIDVFLKEFEIFDKRKS